MDFYILKKGDELKAIPADKAICKSYEKSGYSYIDKVAACTEQAAINKLKGNTLETLKGPLIRLSVVIFALVLLWWVS
ncbi:hypothetical protein AAEU29_08935 [Pseudoalteromonas sp. SSM20]|uniref:hypothetical protein n=1 Tax=unclassified Pseudoalteromonas TaxID=194690 RepID=UPI00237E0234|nr:hypothetical protein [Pseudoalteromonas sp. G4]MDE3271951.1 hypothetical protein [Pseudoalteromonas sp. G4]